MTKAKLKLNDPTCRPDVQYVIAAEWGATVEVKKTLKKPTREDLERDLDESLSNMENEKPAPLGYIGNIGIEIWYWLKEWGPELDPSTVAKLLRMVELYANHYRSFTPALHMGIAAVKGDPHKLGALGQFCRDAEDYEIAAEIYCHERDAKSVREMLEWFLPKLREFLAGCTQREDKLEACVAQFLNCESEWAERQGLGTITNG